MSLIILQIYSKTNEELKKKQSTKQKNMKTCHNRGPPLPNRMELNKGDFFAAIEYHATTVIRC